MIPSNYVCDGQLNITVSNMPFTEMNTQRSQRNRKKNDKQRQDRKTINHQ